MAHADNRCSLCNGYQYDEDKLTTVRGRGKICASCLTCRDCDRKLPKDLLGRHGVDHHRPKLCPFCLKKARKARRAITSKAVPTVGNQKRLVIDMTRKQSRLKSYVRLEREGEGGVVSIIEFGVFVGETNYSATQRLVCGHSLGRYTTNKKGERVLDGRKIETKRMTAINMTLDNNSGIDEARFVLRPTDWLRRLGYRVAARRWRCKNEGPVGYTHLTHAEEMVTRRDELIEEGLPESKKKLIEKMEARRDRNLERLEKFESSVLDEEVEEAPDAIALEAMIIGADEETLRAMREEAVHG